jgi:general secretion pathway protein E
MSFADYARAFLRQNPDVILIGEVRDEETAAAAVLTRGGARHLFLLARNWKLGPTTRLNPDKKSRLLR